MAVAFFFILSGYVLTHAYEKAVASGVMTVRDFAMVRIARLYPLHVLTAIIMACELLRHADIAKTTLTQVIENVTLTQTFFSGDASFNQPSWSISIEFWCGLILLPLWSRSRLAQATAVALATVAFLYADFRGGFIVSYFNRACISLACFAIGWMLCSVNTRPHAVVGWLLAIVAFASMMFPPIVATGRPSIELCYLVAFTGAVFCLAPVKMPHIAQQIARFFGETSYGIYLWHFPLLRVLHPNTLLKSAIFLAVLLLLSWASYRFFERPMMLALRTRLRSSATVDGLRSA